MDAFFFRFQICLRGMLRQVKLNCVILVSLGIGMFIPLTALADIQYFAEYGETAKADIPDAVTYYGFSQKLDTGEIYKLLTENPKLERAAVKETVESRVEYGGETEILQGVSAVSEEYFQFYTLQLVEGRSLEAADFENGSRVCLVETNFYEDRRRKGAAGESIVIDGEEYLVVGIFRMIDERGTVLRPWSQAVSAQSGSPQLRIFLQCGEGVGQEEADGIVQPLFESILSRKTLRQEYEEGQRHGIALCGAILLMILPLIAFSVINCFAVIQGKIRRMRYQFAVKMACGAGKRELFAECFLENLVLCGLALLLNILLIPRFGAFLIPDKINAVWNGWVYLEMFLLMLAVCLVMSLMSVRSILKIGLSSTLKGE